MKILIASDSYKNCLDSLNVATQLEKGLTSVSDEISVEKFYIADGGEGFLEAINYYLKARYVNIFARNAKGENVEVKYLFVDKTQTAFIEVAKIIGVKKQSEGVRTPMYYSSYGVGQVMLHAKKIGAKKIVVGLGGSGTNDGGIGILAACGAKFYDKNHKILASKANQLTHIKDVDLTNFNNFEDVEILIASDVKNYLLGAQGATHTFGVQKGLYPNQLKQLEKGMSNYCQIVLAQHNIDLNNYESGGAAGGIGACLQGFFKAERQNGLDLVLSYSNFEEALKTADFVITGEGQSDHQSLYGKVPAGIIHYAKQYNVKTLIVSGALGFDYLRLYELGFIGIYSICDRVMSFEQALKLAPNKLQNMGVTLAHTLLSLTKV